MESKLKFTEFLLKFISKFWENLHFYGYINKELFTFLWTQQQRVVTKQCTNSFVLSSNYGDKCFQFGPIRRYKYEHSNHGTHSQADHRTINKEVRN